jgi:sortase (surface protein transpeptidase)
VSRPATPLTSAAPVASSTAKPGAIPPLSSIAGPVHTATTAAQAPAPVRVRIPAIDVRSALQPLHLEAGNVLQTPTKFPVAGWYADGVRPGDTGPAIIVGHVDSTAGPAVFFRLKQLHPGDAVYVDRADGSTVRFAVAGTHEYPKRTFPTEAVYGPAPVPTLRLVTCTGDFDAAKRSYVDNLVVTAYLQT